VGYGENLVRGRQRTSSQRLEALGLESLARALRYEILLYRYALRTIGAAGLSASLGKLLLPDYFALGRQCGSNRFSRALVELSFAKENGEGRIGNAREQFNHFAAPERCRRKITSSAGVFIKLVCIQRSC
jgi:hypothetical protein